MPAERLKMRRVREILRYRFEEGLGHKSIAVRVGAAPSTVRETLRRAEVAGLSWPLGDDVSDAVLEAALYKAAGTKTGHRRSVEPDWAHVHRELKRKHVRWSETLPDWIECHLLALEAFGGAPALLVPDNAKVAVIKACHFDPQVNRTYAGMAAHYGSSVLPTRPRRPRDKAKVEAAVRIVERWLLGRMRHRVFYSLADGNAAIVELLVDLNDTRVLRRVGRTRRQLFEEIDYPALHPLCVERYVFAEWRIRRAGLDYHVDIDRHYYSVPYRFAREQVEARITANTIEIFHKGERIAAHRRSSGNGKHTTTPEHMPSSHRRFADWTIERISREASAIGSDVALLCERILADRPHPEQGYRACLGIIRLVKAFERERVNAACGRALEIGARTYGSVRSILDNHLDRSSALSSTTSPEPINHSNIRGPRYYH
jgi:transposase